MKKLFSVLASLVLLAGMMPLAFALSADGSTGGSVEVVPEECWAEDPDIYVDPTARIWEPNDETWYTADYYGEEITNKHGVDGYINPKRGNYVFEGETLKYFVIVDNPNGPADVKHVGLLVGGNFVGQCAQVDDFTELNAFGPNFPGWSDTMASYVCKLVVQDQTGLNTVRIRASTGVGGPPIPPLGGICNGFGLTELDADESLLFNPDVSIILDGSVDFGTVTPGSVAASEDSVTLENDGDAIVDTYIAASDYFTDDSNPFAICGDGNGIPYYAFSYYAMKGTINSGLNDNGAPGLGETNNDPNIEGAICTKAEDEYTTTPSYSGNEENKGRVDDMCRIINWDEDASLLGPGDTMSLLFQLDVPIPCFGDFNNGAFYFIGEVV